MTNNYNLTIYKKQIVKLQHYTDKINALKRQIAPECVTCLNNMLLGVQVTTGLGFFLRSSHLVHTEGSDSLLHRPGPS